MEENQAAHKRRHNEETQLHVPEGSAYYAHTSVDVTTRSHPTIKTTYFQNANTSPAVPTSSSITNLGSSETFDFTSYFNDDQPYLDYLADTSTDTTPVKAKRPRTPADDPQKQWLQERDNFLKEFIRLEGCGDDAWHMHCHGEQTCVNQPSIWCTDCEGLQLYCQSCVISLHRAAPLHRVEIWTGKYFQRSNLRDLGLRVQLGHPTGVRCCNPSPAFQDDFVILDMTGVHSIMLDFCNCETAQTHTTQLLRTRWYPATVTDPRTAATFRVLDHFQMYTFESKGSAFEYYQALARLTDNTRSQQFRHILSLKRAGRGHDPDGALGTTEGELAVLCPVGYEPVGILLPTPACPQPGKNLPLGWETIEAQHKWLYALFLAMDTNFHLCRCNKSSEQADPSLSQGWAYFIEQSGFKDVLDTYASQKSSCASHNAINLADTKNSRGLAATGVGAIVCARHNLTCPSSVGDLQKGERYASLISLMSSNHTGLRYVLVLNISYDIACQWSKHLWERMSRYPSQIHFSGDSKILTFLIPKFHLPAHIAACQTSYSLNLIKGMARTDSEAIERGWSNMNPIATSTREMGPGSRHDILDDHFGDWNWRKVSNLGPSLLKKLKEAIPECYQHAVDLRDFEEAIPSSSLSAWRKLVEDWEGDRSKPNPFEIKVSVVTQASVRLELSQLEAQQLRQGIDASLHPDVSPSILIVVGIDLEALQHRLTTDTANIGIHATDNQLSAMQQRINALRRRIEKWIQIQMLYIPSVARLRAYTSDTEDTTLEEPVHAIKLWMPSAVVKAGHWKLRCAQAHDGLQDLRQHLRLKHHLTGFKKNWLTGQRAHTRSRAVIDTVQAKIDAYCMAWRALDDLADALLCLDLEIEFPKLEDEHIRRMTEAQAGGLVSEGRRFVAVSWIWTQRHGAGEEELSEAMRVEWCKARACANRWAEEVELVQEEMRRVLAFFEWNAGWWEERATSRIYDGAMEHEGAVAYALRQAKIRRSMRNDCLFLWDVVPSLLSVQTTTERAPVPATTTA
ncbi:hypothetical protein DEU56DRAFT_871445 [Suillus clintonianus]|uniref:uncharacterized protein n=1 Tax=Suillus clintonianus TaxID=1904413 RepID=UPI001B865E73|nr:uncharacterized protein DEU56DRAFT_871445 [Suillus clintonianus]KAG2137014.1 hypothetical protein DEU56DRAFT_871445 [Suillus clintonianus]